MAFHIALQAEPRSTPAPAKHTLIITNEHERLMVCQGCP
jgi:hypothetical protein